MDTVKGRCRKKWWPCPRNRQGHQVFMYCLTRKMRMALFSCNFSLSLEFHTMTIQKTKQIEWNSLRFEEAWRRFLNRVLHTSLVYSFVAKLVSDIFCIVTSLTLFLSAHNAAEMRVVVVWIWIQNWKTTLKQNESAWYSVPHGSSLDRF